MGLDKRIGQAFLETGSRALVDHVFPKIAMHYVRLGKTYGIHLNVVHAAL